MTSDAMLIGALSLLLGGNLWFIRRLIASFDGFKAEVREVLREHSDTLARIRERHRIEDRAGVTPPRGFELPHISTPRPAAGEG